MNKIPIGIKTCATNIVRQNAVRDTWFQYIDTTKFMPIFLIGQPNHPTQLVKDILYLDCADSYPLLYTKTLAYFDWVYNNTTASHFWIVDDDSYINANIFNIYNDYLNYDYSGNFIYGINKHNDTSGYCSGCGYCLSRKAVNILLNNVSEMILNRKQSKKTFYEDMLVGDTLNRYMTDLKKINISSIYPWSYCKYIENLMIGHYIHKEDNAEITFYESMKKMHSYYYE